MATLFAHKNIGEVLTNALQYQYEKSRDKRLDLLAYFDITRDVFGRLVDDVSATFKKDGQKFLNELSEFVQSPKERVKHWHSTKFWVDDELISLGEKEAVVMVLSHFSVMLTHALERMSEFESLEFVGNEIVLSVEQQERLLLLLGAPEDWAYGDEFLGYEKQLPEWAFRVLLDTIYAVIFVEKIGSYPNFSPLDLFTHQDDDLPEPRYEDGEDLLVMENWKLKERSGLTKVGRSSKIKDEIRRKILCPLLDSFNGDEKALRKEAYRVLYERTQIPVDMKEVKKYLEQTRAENKFLNYRVELFENDSFDDKRKRLREHILSRDYYLPTILDGTCERFSLFE